MRHALPSINRLLATLSLVCVLPVTVLFLAEISWSYSTRRAQLLEGAVLTARALTAGVDERLHSVSVALENLSRSPALAEGNLAAFHDEASAVAKALGVRNIALVDADGHQLVNTRDASADEQSAATHPRVTELVGAKTPRVLDLFLAPIEKRWVAGMGMATQIGGRPGYALAASIEPSLLQDSLLRERLPAPWTAAVLDSGGRIVARTRDHERLLGTPARAALVARIAEVPEDAVESVTVDGVPVVTAFSRSASTQWSIAIGIPRADLVAPLRSMLWAFGVGTAAVLGLTLALSRRLATRISDSLRVLAAEARSVGHRSAIDLPPAAFMEADHLGQALVHADVALRDAQEARNRAEALLEAALQGTTDPLVVVDSDDEVVATSASAARHFGVAQDMAIGLPIQLLLAAAADSRITTLSVLHVGDRAFRVVRLGTVEAWPVVTP